MCPHFPAVFDNPLGVEGLGEMEEMGEVVEAGEVTEEVAEEGVDSIDNYNPEIHINPKIDCSYLCCTSQRDHECNMAAASRRPLQKVGLTHQKWRRRRQKATAQKLAGGKAKEKASSWKGAVDCAKAYG